MALAAHWTGDNRPVGPPMTGAALGSPTAKMVNQRPTGGARPTQNPAPKSPAAAVNSRPPMQSAGLPQPGLAPRQPSSGGYSPLGQQGSQPAMGGGMLGQQASQPAAAAPINVTENTPILQSYSPQQIEQNAFDAREYIPRQFMMKNYANNAAGGNRGDIKMAQQASQNAMSLATSPYADNYQNAQDAQAGQLNQNQNAYQLALLSGQRAGLGFNSQMAQQQHQLALLNSLIGQV